jgi:hypothetical protein
MDTGTHDVTVIATDEFGNTSIQSYAVSVASPGPANRGPLFVTDPITQFNVKSADTAGIPIDLTPWQFIDLPTAGSQPPASWVISNGGTTVTQTVNSRPAIFLADFELADDRIEGTWRVNTTNDDDYMGFVFGYQDPQHFYLFDWKQANQTEGTIFGERGMTLKRVSASTPLVGADLSHTAGTPGRVTPLYHNTIPWNEFVTYGFSLEFHPGEFTIRVTQGATTLASFTLQDSTYVDGGFGFYNNSQNAVVYAGFTREELPDRVYRYPAVAVDPEADPLTYSLVNSPAGMTINSSTGEIEWPVTSAQVGTHAIEIQADHGQGNVTSQIFNLQILDVNPASVSGLKYNDLDGDGIRDAGEPGLAGWTIYSDTNQNGRRDSLEPLAITNSTGAYTFINLMPGTHTFAEQPQTGWNQTAPVGGTHTVTLAAGGTATNLNFGNRANGITANSPPIFTSAPLTTAKVNNVYWYASRATDADNHVLTFSLLDSPSGMTVDPASGVIVWTPAPNQQFPQPILLQVSDGNGGLDLQSFKILVAPEFQPPSITTAPIRVGTVDELYTYDVDAFDPENNSITYFLDSAPADMSIHSSTGVITWTPGSSDLGDHAIQVRATDTTGLSGYQTYTLSIRDVNTAPIFQSTPLVEIAAGATYRYTALATDTEDGILYSLVTSPSGMTINAQYGLIQWTTELVGWRLALDRDPSDGRPRPVHGLALHARGHARHDGTAGSRVDDEQSRGHWRAGDNRSPRDGQRVGIHARPNDRRSGLPIELPKPSDVHSNRRRHHLRHRHRDRHEWQRGFHGTRPARPRSDRHHSTVCRHRHADDAIDCQLPD